MIDWLTFTAVLTHDVKINGGKVVALTRDNQVQWESIKWEHFTGSHDSRVMVRSHPNMPGAWIDVSGNPAKFLQGHNLFGSSNLPGLVEAMLHRICDQLGIVPSPEDLKEWAAGNADLRRVDITESYSLGSRPRVHSALRSLEQQSRLAFRGRGTMTKESTLYFGKHSRRWSLKFYSKGDELEAKSHKLPFALDQEYPDLAKWADDKIRAEITLRGMELQRLGLGTVADWFDTDADSLHHSYMEKLDVSDISEIAPEVIDGMKPALRAAYQCWLDGYDLRAMYPRMTFYRYRLALQAHGIDIALVRPAKPKSNVIPLKVVLHAYPAGVPDFANGTPLLFEPPKRLRA